MKIVATTSLPAVDRPNADRWNAARSPQLFPPEKGSSSPPKAPPPPALITVGLTLFFLSRIFENEMVFINLNVIIHGS